jgi:hypothetical protein
VLSFAFVYSKQSDRPATITVTIREAETGRLTPVRVSLTDAEGNRPRIIGALTVSESAIAIPKEAVAVMYGRSDKAEGYMLQPDGSFYVDGKFTAQLPPGAYTLTFAKGYEFVKQTHTLILKAGEAATRDYQLRRWIDMPKRGWYSSDDHIHLRRSPRDNPSVLRWIAAEDIHVGNLLEMGDFWATYYSQYGFGDKGRYQEGNYIVSSGQEEPRTPEIGHTISLGAREFVRFQRDYYSYGRVFDQVHQLGGITGFAHQAMTYYGYRGMTLNLLRQKIDFLEVMQFCSKEGPLALEHYHHFLDLGYKLTALAGSDFPWCGRGPRYGVKTGCTQIGDARFYTYTGAEFSFQRWLEAVKAGHTFVSTGPILELSVNGKIPGDSIDVERGATIRISAKAYGHESQIPLSELAIVGHGQTLKRVTVDEPRKNTQRLSADLELKAGHGIWIAAYARAASTQLAYSTPVYVSVGGGGFHNPETASRNLELSRKYLREVEEELSTLGDAVNSQAVRHRESLQGQVSEAREVIKHLESRLSSQFRN